MGKLFQSKTRNEGDRERERIEEQGEKEVCATRSQVPQQGKLGGGTGKEDESNGGFKGAH